jgi:hypothetical protein
MKISNRELIVATITIALGTVIPFLFHGIKGAGSLFLPMFYPVVIAGFFLSPPLAAITGLLTPITATLLTGMPPINPPIMFIMSIELAVLCLTISLLEQKLKINYYLNISISMLINRIIYTILLLVFARFFNLPGFSFALVKLISGWPGFLVIITILPAIAKSLQQQFNRVDIYAES